MMRHVKLLTLVAALLAFGAPGASAWLSANGTGSATASTATLATPAITMAAPAAGTVTLSWSEITPPAAGSVLYYVTRDGGAPAGDCATASSATSATSCTDSGLAAGSHSYTVIAVWRSWTSTSATRVVTIASGAATHLVLAIATTTPTAGAADNLTITAKDASDNTVTSYIGDKSLTFGGAAPAPDGTSPTVTDTAGTPRSLGAATTLTFASGVASVAGSSNGVLRLYRAGTATITATDGTIDSNRLDVTVAPAAAARLAVSGYPSSTVAGVSHAFAVTALDAFANTASGYAGTVSFSASNDPQAVLPANATLTSGTASFGATFKTVAGGGKTLTATDTAAQSITGSQSGISVTRGPAATIAVASGSGQSADVRMVFASPLVAVVRDAFGNPVSDLSVTFAGPLSGAGGTFAAAGCTSNTPAAQCVATTAANGQATSSAFTANTTAGPYDVAASASGTNSVNFGLTNIGQNTFEVTVASPQTAGTSFNATITAKNGAGTDTSYTGTKCILLSGPSNSPNATAPTYPAQQGCVAGSSSVTFSAGVRTLSVTLARAAASTTLTATEGAITGSSSPFAVNSAAVALSYNRACPLAIAKNSTTAFAINVPNDAFGNPFTRTSALGIGLSLTGAQASNFGFGVGTGTQTATVNITSGPAANTFNLVENGANKSAAITATAPSGFTPPASCTVTAGN